MYKFSIKSVWMILTKVLLIGLFPHDSYSIDEKTYKEVHPSVVIPFYRANSHEGKLKVDAQTEIAYNYFEHQDPIGSLVILQGWTEHYGGYTEFAYDMYQQGISTYFFDWRGQGLSTRPLEDPHKSYILDYKGYFADLDTFMEQIVKPRAKRPIVAQAFSMGANILSLYESIHPRSFDRLLMIAPMLDIRTTPFPQWMAWAFASLFEFIGLGDQYVFGHGPYKGTHRNNVSSSDVRFENWRQTRINRPEIIVNGTTWSWLRASLEATWQMREQAKDLKSPIMMLQAGKDDIVNTEGQDYVCAQAPNCLKIVFPQSRHAILAESDRIRSKALREIVDFVIHGY